MPNLAQFQNTILVAGSYNGPPAHAPALRDAAGVTAQALMDGPGLPPPGSMLSISVPAGGGAPTLATTPVVHEGAPLAADPATGGLRVSFVAPGPAGNAVYLPFLIDRICYTLLPADPASNVDFFYTDNLSGCSVFIDQIPGTNDLVVMHANRLALTQTGVPAPVYLATTPFADQYPAARTSMRADRIAVRNALNAALGVMPVPLAALERADYYLCVENEKARKRAQNRTNVDIGAAGTNVMGFRVGGVWQFWWQTWAILTYDRPLNSPEALRSGIHQGLVPGTAVLLDVQQFH